MQLKTLAYYCCYSILLMNASDQLIYIGELQVLLISVTEIRFVLFISLEGNSHNSESNCFSKITRFYLFDAFWFRCVQVLSAKVPCANERDDLWQVFYQGPAFSTLARFLLLGNFFFLNCLALMLQQYFFTFII